MTYHSIILTLGLIFMTVISHSVSANERVLNIVELQSPKGIKIWHTEDHSLPIITLNFAFRDAGSIMDPVDKIGLGQLVSNTLDEGAGNRDANAFQKALQDHAIELSFENSRDYFSGKIKTLKHHSDLAFELLRDSLHSPRFDEEAIQRMRNANIMRVKQSLAKSEWVAARLMNDVYFGTHPYAMNSGGTLSGLRSVQAVDMHDFVKNDLTKDRLIVATAGDLTAEEAQAVVDSIFADLPDGKDLSGSVSDIEPLEAPVKKAYKMNSPQSSVQMVWPSFSKNDPDYYALTVMNHLLGGGGFSSYLMEEIREKKGLTYGIYSQPVFMNHANYLLIDSACSPENIEPMTNAIKDVLKKMTSDNVDIKLLADAKNYLVGSLPLQFSSTQSLSSVALKLQLDNRPITALDEWSKNINSVTADDVKRVANRIFESLEPKATVIAGAVPDRQEFEMIETIPGVE